jgi:hypothetical protein
MPQNSSGSSSSTRRRKAPTTLSTERLHTTRRSSSSSRTTKKHRLRLKFEKKVEKKRLKEVEKALLKTRANTQAIFASKTVRERTMRTTTCWCGGLRVHQSCATTFNVDTSTSHQLCVFEQGRCTSDGLSCVPCIVCHRTKDTDDHPSLRRDFPDGDNWLFREERVCPGCLSGLAKEHNEHNRCCDVCAFDFNELVQ